MRTSARGTCSAAVRHGVMPRRLAGFTLLEILVVVAIVAIASGIAMVALGSDERGLVRREAQRFGGALEYAAARAQWHNETLGVSAAGQDVRFWRRRDDTGAWSPVAGDDVLAARRLPDALHIGAVSYAGHAIASNAIVPLRASGRNEPAVFALAASAAQVRVA